MENPERPFAAHGDAKGSAPKFIPPFLGYCFLKSGDTLASLDLVRHATAPALQIGDIGHAGIMAIVMICVAILSKSAARPLSTRRLTTGCVIICALAGIIEIAASAEVLPGWTCAIVTSLMGVGTAAFTLIWFAFYARMAYPVLVVHLALAQGVSASLVTLFSLPSLNWAVPTACLLFPILSLVCYHKSLNWLENHSLPEGEQVVGTGWSFPIRPVVVIGLFAFVNSSVRSNMEADRGYAAFGVAAAMLLFAAAALFLSRRFDATAACHIAFPLMVFGPLCIIVGEVSAPAIISPLSTLGAISTNAGSAVFLYYVYVLLCAMSYRYGINPLWLFGFSLAADNIGKFVSKLLEAGNVYLIDDTFTNCLIVLLVVILYAFFHADTSPLKAWGMSHDEMHRDPDSEKHIDGTDQQGIEAAGLIASTDNLVDACARAARAYGLTRREEEILFGLAQDLGAGPIATRLCLAESTVKTFIKHIYAKMGIHSRTEVAQSVGEFLRERR